MAYMIVKRIRKNAEAFELTLLNWRTVFLIGALASVINSVTRVTVLGNMTQLSNILEAIAKVIVGDMVGLAIGLVSLLFVFRLVRRRPI